MRGSNAVEGTEEIVLLELLDPLRHHRLVQDDAWLLFFILESADPPIPRRVDTVV